MLTDEQANWIISSLGDEAQKTEFISCVFLPGRTGIIIDGETCIDSEVQQFTLEELRCMASLIQQCGFTLYGGEVDLKHKIFQLISEMEAS